MKVYAEVLPGWLGRAMYRINREIKRTAPQGIEFVDDATRADVQILDVIGTGSLDHLCVRAYVLLQHCYLTTERPEASYWLPIFDAARLVVSYHDLRALTGSDEFAFYRAPLGVDGTLFHEHDMRRDIAVLTTGYDAAGEAIRECHDAVFRELAGRGGGAIHVGASSCAHERAEAVEGISDEELARCYSRCRYVSGLRRGEGFELPVIEGLACGARPICFDTPGYRHWFDGHAVFVPEAPYEELVVALADVFEREPKAVTAEERGEVLQRFSWDLVLGEFWRMLLEK
jgi:glycosyltransferase involved in cell wall biosynthesis